MSLADLSIAQNALALGALLVRAPRPPPRPGPPAPPPRGRNGSLERPHPPPTLHPTRAAAPQVFYRLIGFYMLRRRFRKRA